MIVGIDLGTTNSLVAVWRDGRSELIPNALGDTLTPSCVSLDADGSVLVGRPALERRSTHPDRTASLFKRYMGSDRTVRLGGRSFRAEELSALVLKSLKADAEALLGEPVTEAVITVPAYFSEAQRQATRAAGELAGLKVARLLNEPTAAALARGLHLRGQESRFLVFDLGGGTFDVSVLDLFEGVMEVRASAGDNFLGGEDFAQALVERFFQQHDLPASLKSDAVFMQRLGAQAEAAKRALSVAPTARMVATVDGRALNLDLDEAALEAVIAPLLKRLRAPIERALRDARLRSSELDEVVLAGGATRMPLVRRLVTALFGRFPAVDMNPDEVVAHGAAVQAGLVVRDAALEEVVMTDVAPYSLGVEVSIQLDARSRSAGHFSPIIERNTTVPASRVSRYQPVDVRQRELELNIYQGESRLVKDNILLGTLTVPLPSSDGELAEVDVRFTYDVNGLLEVEATLVGTGQTSRCTIEGKPGQMTPEQIQARMRELATLKIHPRDQLVNRTLLARGERLFEQLRGEARDWLGHRIVGFEQVLATQEPRAIDAARPAFAAALEDIERETPLDGAPRMSAWVPGGLAFLGLDADAGERDVRRAYAQRLKRIDPATDAAGFQSLREAYESALAWVNRPVAPTPLEPEAEPPPGAADGTAPLEPVEDVEDVGENDPDLAAAEEAWAALGIDDQLLAALDAGPMTGPEAAASLAATEATAVRDEALEAVFAEFVARVHAPLTNEAGASEALELALQDARLSRLDDAERFERRVAQLLLDGWQPGHEFLFGPATARFEWASDLRKLETLGAAGRVLGAALIEKQYFFSQTPTIFRAYVEIIRRLRDPSPPSRWSLMDGMPRVRVMLELYPNWWPMLTSTANVRDWFARYEALPASDRPKPPPPPPPRPAYREERTGWWPSRWMIFLAVSVLINVVRSCLEKH